MHTFVVLLRSTTNKKYFWRIRVVFYTYPFFWLIKFAAVLHPPISKNHLKDRLSVLGSSPFFLENQKPLHSLTFFLFWRNSTELLFLKKKSKPPKGWFCYTNVKSVDDSKLKDARVSETFPKVIFSIRVWRICANGSFGTWSRSRSSWSREGRFCFSNWLNFMFVTISKFNFFAKVYPLICLITVHFYQISNSFLSIFHISFQNFEELFDVVIFFLHFFRQQVFPPGFFVSWGRI